MIQAARLCCAKTATATRETVDIIEKESGEREIINLDFVTRIRQYPKKKNGKKKSVVFD